ncbi:hypothetical protein PMZ80_009800 [Knufia obscura]|uniref:Uncharacterized protein n=1 Tax=Knufia obscura TaxID=1635080 RepID=A0ABR0RC90_9EURO|nr:hypothetical protein PMZ80_009800 [Knufia obscura]
MVAETEDEGSTPTKRHIEAEPWHSLVRFDDLPHWQQDNHYILSGYRKASYSYFNSMQSMLHWHNESINIWTHFLPGVLFLPLGGILYNALKARYELASSADIYVMSCFFICVGTGMLMSGIFHTLSNHSPKVAKFWNQLDHVGIAFMIWGSFVPSVHYGFWCEPDLRNVYWTMVRTPYFMPRLDLT